MRSRDSLLDAIARDEARLSALDIDREKLRTHVESLRAEIAVSLPPATGPLPPTPAKHLPVLPSTPVPANTSAKVALFRCLFRGRDDVFPKWWKSAKTGRDGYSPVCSNDRVPGVCYKPKVKCGACTHQAFVPVADRLIVDHLKGRHVLGVYPLLRDETCWFLAADFDDDAWLDDVTAFRDTCRTLGVPVAVERSRSGNGGHAWFFFTAPVRARAARAMACFLLTETMTRRHQVRLTSYDRLFPSQDTMPSGGFGNLIALPLQGPAVALGNTVFLDDGGVPHANQWAYLTSIERITPSRLDAIVADATRRDRVLAARPGRAAATDSDATPWLLPPSRRTPVAPISEPLPKEVRVIVAQRLFVGKAGLPSSLLSQIKRLAAFQNPEFYSKQRLRLPTWGTARVIGCAEEDTANIGLPRGCRDELIDLLRAHEISPVIEDQRGVGEPIKVAFRGTLTPGQEAAARAIASHDVGVFAAPPGTGKTVIAAWLIAARGRSTLILVHRKPLLEQWIKQLADFLGIEPKKIGILRGGKRKPSGFIDVGMIQSLSRKGVVDDIVATYGNVIVDECHHVPAVSFERVLAEVKARYVTGLTATPYRRDGLEAILHLQCGPIRHAIDPTTPPAGRAVVRRVVVRETGFRADALPATAGIHELYVAIVADERRNALIVGDVACALAEGRSPIVLTERRAHLEMLAEKLRHLAEHTVVLHGAMSALQRRAAIEQLASIPERAGRLVLAIGKYIGEGFDDARLDTLFLTMPVSWKGTVVQYAGRLHRAHRSKIEVQIYDYVDEHVPMLARMHSRRVRGYRLSGYTFDPQQFAFDLDDDGTMCDDGDGLDF